MSVTVYLPSALQALAANREFLVLPEGSVRDVLKAAGTDNPALSGELFANDGSLRPHTRVYVNDEDIRYLKGIDTMLQRGDVVTLVPSLTRDRS